ncbi:MAG: RdgB/HAM1 family non-canonical purine NTP pyrophosphatase [Marinilabiliaceae bacterium]
MDLIFATHNQNKSREINKLLGSAWNVRSLDDVGFHQEIPETGSSLEENALQKARFVWNELGVTCFADDTGLEIDALNGEPGVYSARYAGPEKDSMQNMEKVLEEMAHVSDRKARFRTVIALIMDGKEVLFEGRVEGKILREMIGDQGFGYDPIFQPDEADGSFASMSLARKNQISHRARAIRKLVDYLESIKNQ